MSRVETRGALNGLIETCHDGESGFLEAAEVVADEHLRTILTEFAEQRRQFAAQLKYELCRRGASPGSSGSFFGAVHRRWMGVKAAILRGGLAAIVGECERGEDLAIRSYDKALSRPLPEDLKILLREHQVQIRAAREMLRSLEGKLVRLPA